MILILDGIDKSGKSTFAKELCKLFPFKVYKFTRKPKDDSKMERQKIKTHYLATLETIVQLPDIMHVFDRFHFSELAYSKKRGYEAMDDKWFFDILETKIKKHPHLVVYCFCEKEKILQRMIIEKEEYMEKEDLDEILARYEKVLGMSQLNIIKINTSDDAKINLRKVFDFYIKANFDG